MPSKVLIVGSRDTSATHSLKTIIEHDCKDMIVVEDEMRDSNMMSKIKGILAFSVALMAGGSPGYGEGLEKIMVSTRHTSASTRGMFGRKHGPAGTHKAHVRATKKVQRRHAYHQMCRRAR